jgi:hypothetical protein
MPKVRAVTPKQLSTYLDKTVILFISSIFDRINLLKIKLGSARTPSTLIYLDGTTPNQPIDRSTSLSNKCYAS